MPELKVSDNSLIENPILETIFTLNFFQQSYLWLLNHILCLTNFCGLDTFIFADAKDTIESKWSFTQHFIWDENQRVRQK